jgi:DNA-directed RNA polymerase specialized sigma24 family protein
MSYMEPEALIETYDDLCKRIAHGMENRTTHWHEFDDLLQEAYISLLHANEIFDESREIPFLKFAATHIYLRLIDAVRASGAVHRRRNNNDYWNIPLSIEAITEMRARRDHFASDDIRFRDPNAEAAFEEVEDRIADEEVIAGFVEYWIQTTNPGQTRMHLMEDLTNHEFKTFQSIADDIGVCGGRITQLFRAIEPTAHKYGELLTGEF